jgi:CubicO group peptidase (beta-lactamase class C family)
MAAIEFGRKDMLVRTIGALLALGIALPAAAQGIPRAQSPEEVGFVSTRLKRINERIEEGVKNNELPGAVVLIARNGKIVMFDAFGYRDKEAKAPMKTDSIFRIASMTKPFTSVAAMILVEEGKLSLADPVSKYIPAFAETKVATQKNNPDGTVENGQEPQSRAMTVQDLMRHTSGLTYGAAGFNRVKQSYVDMKMMDANQTNAQMVEKLAKLALLYQPGTHWEYSMSTDVLGRVVEVASGLTLDKFIEERISKPLKLGDTGFEAAPDKKDRAARPQKEGPKNELPNIPDITLKATWKSGGGGMVSTAADYARFLQMFANGGQLDGARILSRKTIDLMTADHLPPDIIMGEDMWRFEALEPSARMGQGFGLGFAVRNEQGRNPLPGSPNDYYWGGAYGTYFWHDPREHMYVVFMMQSQTARLPYRYLMRDLVYQALIGN